MKKMCIIMIALLVFPVIAYAASDGAIITLNLPAGKTVETSTYNFTGKNHVVVYDVDEIRNSAYEQKVVIALYKKNLLSTPREARREVAATYHTRQTIKMGEHSSGKHYYGFGAHSNAFKSSTVGISYAGMVSDMLHMYSY